MGAARKLSDAEEIELLELQEAEERDRIHALWRAGELSWKLHEGQRVIYDGIQASLEQEQLVFCARQFGKTYLNVIIALEFCLRNPGSIVRIAAETLDQVQNIINDNLEPIVADAPPGLIRKMKAARRWQVGRSQIRFGALARSHVDTLRGGNARLILTEECGFVTSEDFEYAIRSVIGPQLLRSGGKLIHFTTPSEDPEHFVHNEIMPKCALAGSLYRFDVYQNPQLTPELIAKAIKLAGGEHTDTWKREYLVQVLRPISLMCVPEFSLELNVRESEQLPFANWATFIDFGGVRDKTVAHLVAYDFKRAKDVLWDERVFDPNTDTDTIMTGVFEMEAAWGLVTRDEQGAVTRDLIKQRYSDAPGQLLVDLMTLYKYYVQLPLKDDWKASLNALRLRVGEGDYEVHPRCKFSIQTFLAATFNKTRTDFNRTQVLGHMDAVAAAMYGNRMLDRTTNPYPAAPTNAMTRFQRPTVSGKAAIAALNPLAARRAR